MDPFDLMAARLTAPTAPTAPERRPQVAPGVALPGARKLLETARAAADRLRRGHRDQALMRRMAAAEAPVLLELRVWPSGAGHVRVEIVGGQAGRVLLGEAHIDEPDDDDDAAE